MIYVPCHLKFLHETLNFYMRRNDKITLVYNIIQISCIDFFFFGYNYFLFSIQIQNLAKLIFMDHKTLLKIN